MSVWIWWIKTSLHDKSMKFLEMIHFSKLEIESSQRETWDDVLYPSSSVIANIWWDWKDVYYHWDIICTCPLLTDTQSNTLEWQWPYFAATNIVTILAKQLILTPTRSITRLVIIHNNTRYLTLTSDIDFNFFFLWENIHLPYHT